MEHFDDNMWRRGSLRDYEIRISEEHCHLGVQVQQSEHTLGDTPVHRHKSKVVIYLPISRLSACACDVFPS